MNKPLNGAGRCFIIASGLILMIVLAGVSVYGLDRNHLDDGTRYPVFRFKPVNELSRDLELGKTVRDMIACCGRRDWKSLRTYLEPGLADSIEKNWKPENSPARNPFWGEMVKTLRLGGTFDDGNTYTTPYATTGFPDEKLRAYFTNVAGYDYYAPDFITVTAFGVQVRQGPGTNYPVVDTVSHQVVYYREWELTNTIESLNGYWYGWYPVLTPAGISGFIYGEYLFHFLGNYRAVFSREKGKWLMVEFYNG